MSEVVEIEIVAEQVPAYALPGDAGADLRSNETVTVGPGERALIGTGVSFAMPDGVAAFVMPRSGLAAKHGITVLNAPGTVDSGYRGEVKVTLLNTDRDAAFEVRPGDRIAQVVFMRVARAAFTSVDALPESVRGAGGFGSTGFGAQSPEPGTPGA